MRKRKRLAGGLLAACVLCMAGAAGGAPAAPAPRDALAAGAVDGVALEEWTARWWQWAESQWIAPYRDPDGRLCALGQSGPVWFLAGTDGTFDALRTCTIPADVHVLVPVINTMQSVRSRGGKADCAGLQAGAAVNNDRLVSAVVLLDGRSLGDIRGHRVRTPACFRLGRHEAAPLAASDGYWLMLAPLPRGRHRLMVGANYGAPDSPYGRMQQHFEYVLDVGGPILVSEAGGPPRGRTQ
ncbi:hypothetical protein LDO32_00550 [Luteimonas sp. Y-2-2-4F]|nr:hypothetical protein [Luteimonas sp. Y-2-2-4F]MCD9030225.1 hypothetical protein [Luteimonas sp. Y-2-2-4F]